MIIAVITGASGGLGEQYVKEASLLPDIYEIWMIARRRDRMKRIAELVKKPCRIISMDLTERTDLSDFECMLSKENPDIRYLINNAGMVENDRFCNEDILMLQKMIDLNITAAVTLTKLCIPYMKSGSNIIQISSVSAFAPFYDLPLYAATKTCLLHFSKALRAQLESKDIHILTVCAGNMETGMNSRKDQMAKGSRNQFVPYLSLSAVCKGSFRAVHKNKAVYTPGLIYKLFRIFCIIVPDSLLLKIIRA